MRQDARAASGAPGRRGVGTRIGIAIACAALGASLASCTAHAAGEGAGPASIGEDAGPASIGEGAGPASIGEGAGPASIGEGAGPASIGEGAGPASIGEDAGPTPIGGAGLLAREHRTRPARRIVSIVPAVTEMLFAIGAGPQVVAVSSYDNWPPEVRSLTRVGALLDPDIERILRLHPDLVIVYGTQSEFETKLNRAGVPTFPYVLGGLDNLMTTIRRLGPLVGRDAEAGQVADRLQARFEAIRARVAGKRRPRTLLVFGHEPGTLRAIDASGGVGFLSDIVALAGGDNVFGAEKRESVRVGTESILAAAPEVIIDIHYGHTLGPGQVDRDRAAWKTLSAVPAVRMGRVALLVGDEYVVPGPRLADAAEAIADVIHPARRR